MISTNRVIECLERNGFKTNVMLSSFHFECWQTLIKSIFSVSVVVCNISLANTCLLGNIFSCLVRPPVVKMSNFLYKLIILPDFCNEM